MSKDMLGPIVRALVGVPQQHHGVVLDVVNKLGGDAADSVRKRVAQALREPAATEMEAKVEEAPLDTIIRVDRSVRPPYPDWVQKVMHPELEAGPAEYDLATVEQWLHEDQKSGYVRGQAIYDHLKANNLLDSCLGLADGLAIQQKGIKVFRKFYRGKVVFFWRSVVLDRDGFLHVPALFEYGGGVKLRWYWLGRDWLSSHPALRLAS